MAEIQSLEDICNALIDWCDNFEDKCMECMDSNQSVFVASIREQLYSGIDGSNNFISPTYESDPFFNEKRACFYDDERGHFVNCYHHPERYIEWKRRITPPVASQMLGLPARPDEVPNLFINGKFHSEISSSKGDGQIDIDVVEAGDGPAIIGKFGSQILEIGDVATKYFNERYLLPHLQDYFDSLTNGL